MTTSLEHSTDNYLQQLERQIDLLIQKHSQLAKAHYVLYTQHQKLASSHQALLEKNQHAHSHIDRAIDAIKNMEMSAS